MNSTKVDAQIAHNALPEVLMVPLKIINLHQS